jgi:hypothetical protein
MSAGRAGKSHATAWTLVILAVPVLYLVTEPPITCFCGTTTEVTMKSGYTSFSVADPRWVHFFHLPYAWITANTPLKDVLDLYTTWWWKHSAAFR